MTAESSTTPADPRALLNAAIEHAPKTILAGPLADLVIREMCNGLWWLDKTEAIQTDSDLSEITFDVVYASKARQVLSLSDTEGVASLRASGAPVERIADALKDMRLNLGPHALEAIHGGANHLVLSGAERHAIALTALKALGMEES